MRCTLYRAFDHRQRPTSAGRSTINFMLRRRAFPCSCRRELTLRSVASVQGLNLNAGEKARIADSSSRNAVKFSSARNTKRFPSPHCASTARIVHRFSQQVDTNRPFQFQKRRQLFIRTYDEALSVITMRVCNPDCLPVGINR
jgi:hypothetical protein